MKVTIKTVKLLRHILNISPQNGDIIFVLNKYNDPLGDCKMNQVVN